MFGRKLFCGLACWGLLGGTLAFAQEVERPSGGVVDFLAPILPNPLLQHSKEIYVLYGCAYCHGVDLKVRNGESADLLHSPIVAVDVDANVIGPLLRNGIPQTAKLSPMPQFSDLSEREIKDLARWIHYSRQQEMFKLLTAATAPAVGNAGLGKAYFVKQCGSCHEGSLFATAAKRLDDQALKARILRPAMLDETPSFQVGQLHNTRTVAGRQRHGSLLENYSPQELADLVAYAQILSRQNSERVLARP